jgi:hypothetical protein
VRGARGVADACPCANGCPSCIGAPDAPPAGADAVVIQLGIADAKEVVNAKQAVRAFLSAWAGALED